MRIEICGGGAVGLLQQNLRGMRGGITATIESLQSVRRQLTGISGGATGNVSNAISGVNDRIQEENAKLERVQTLEKKTDDFLLHTVAADQQVARTVTQNREKLFSKYSWLRPAGSGVQSWWDERVKDWNRFWSKAGEAIGKVVDGVVTFIKEHAVQLIVGTIGIAIGIVVAVVAGVELAAAALAAAEAVAISMLISGAINAVIALFSGGDVLQAFLDGLADGYMWGGICFAIGSIVSAARGLFSGKPVKGQSQVNFNKKTGDYMEMDLFSKFKAKYPNAKQQITIETEFINEKGLPHKVKFRIDQIAKSKDQFILQELKGSPTAPLTKNQEIGFKALYENGGVIKGVGKGDFHGGVKIPAGTEVTVIRSGYSYTIKHYLNRLMFGSGLLSGIFGGETTPTPVH